jgi:putative membrane protein
MSPIQRAALALGVTAVIAAGTVLLLSDGAYLWIKAFHVIAIITWMAGMLYLPRLFVYHSGVAPGSEQSEMFKVMERRLLTAIINPAMVLSWVFGTWLAYTGGYFAAPWFHAKLAFVIAMSAMHGYLSAAVRAFAEDRNRKSARHWRIVNEIPTVLMIGIVILVIVKPF